MSQTAKQPEHECQFKQGCAAIELIIQPHSKDLGGFSVRRSLPNARKRTIGPWIFFDHMGPAQFPAGDGINVRPHPHIGITTVTYLFEGEILHRDSLGNEQAIVPGDLNLMVCGSGIVHSERQRDEIKAKPQTLHGLQLWLALPQADEEIDPAFHHYASSELPRFEVDGVKGRVMMGQAYGQSSPARTLSDTLYIEADIPAGKSLTLPNAAERGLYIASGELMAGDTTLEAHSLTVLSAAQDVVVTATQDTRIAVVGGESLGERFIEWNFVSSRRERIAQAKQDWLEKRFPSVPGDDQEFIPLPQ